MITFIIKEVCYALQIGELVFIFVATKKSISEDSTTESSQPENLQQESTQNNDAQNTR